MMIIKYKPKPPLVFGVHVTSIESQSGEIASLISAKNFSVSIGAGSAVFALDDKEVTVKNGQVVTMQAGAVVVYDQAEFLAAFEPYDSV